MTSKRGMVRLWIVIAIVVDLYLAFTLVTSLEAGIPVGATWGRRCLYSQLRTSCGSPHY
jgi:hypothetical protein